MPHRDIPFLGLVSRASPAATLAAAVCLAAPSVTAGPFGIPLERQPFIKVCPDGTIVGSLGPNLRGETRDTYGAFVRDGRTGRTEFLKRDRDFDERLAEDPCVADEPDPRKPRG